MWFNLNLVLKIIIIIIIIWKNWKIFLKNEFHSYKLCEKTLCNEEWKGTLKRVNEECEILTPYLKWVS